MAEAARPPPPVISRQDSSIMDLLSAATFIETGEAPAEIAFEAGEEQEEEEVLDDGESGAPQRQRQPVHPRTARLARIMSSTVPHLARLHKEPEFRDQTYDEWDTMSKEQRDMLILSTISAIPSMFAPETLAAMSTNNKSAQERLVPPELLDMGVVAFNRATRMIQDAMKTHEVSAKFSFNKVISILRVLRRRRRGRIYTARHVAKVHGASVVDLSSTTITPGTRYAAVETSAPFTPFLAETPKPSQ